MLPATSVPRSIEILFIIQIDFDTHINKNCGILVNLFTFLLPQSLFLLSVWKLFDCMLSHVYRDTHTPHNVCLIEVGCCCCCCSSYKFDIKIYSNHRIADIRSYIARLLNQIYHYVCRVRIGGRFCCPNPDRF